MIPTYLESALKHLVVILVSLFWSLSAAAEATPWQHIPNGQARLLSSASDSGNTVLGLDFYLDEGWKIYWTYAGPVGQPTKLSFHNLKPNQVAVFFFPWPKRGDLQGYPSYSYSDATTFLALIEGTPESGFVQADLAICSQTQCIPHRLTMALPKGAGQKDPVVLNKLRRAFDTLPVPSADMPHMVIDQESQEIRLPTLDSNRFDDFLVHVAGSAAREGFFLNPAVADSHGGLRASYNLRNKSQELGFLDEALVYARGDSGSVVFDLSQDRAFRKLAESLDLSTPATDSFSETEEPLLSTSANALNVEPQPERLSVLMAAILLLLGGFLLNFMPCVLPVLFLKMKAIAQLDKDNGNRLASIRRSFAWTAVGTISTFLIFGLFLSLGRNLLGIEPTLGAWMQFPLVTVVLTTLLTLFVANAFGWFDFVVPGSIAGLGSHRRGLLGDVLAGFVVAVLGGLAQVLYWPFL